MQYLVKIVTVGDSRNEAQDAMQSELDTLALQGWRLSTMSPYYIEGEEGYETVVQYMVTLEKP